MTTKYEIHRPLGLIRWLELKDGTRVLQHSVEVKSFAMDDKLIKMSIEWRPVEVVKEE